MLSAIINYNWYYWLVLIRILVAGFDAPIEIRGLQMRVVKPTSDVNARSKFAGMTVELDLCQICVNRH